MVFESLRNGLMPLKFQCREGRKGGKRKKPERVAQALFDPLRRAYRNAFGVGTFLFLAGCDSKHIARSASVGSSKV